MPSPTIEQIKIMMQMMEPILDQSIAEFEEKNHIEITPQKRAQFKQTIIRDLEQFISHMKPSDLSSPEHLTNILAQQFNEDRYITILKAKPNDFTISQLVTPLVALGIAALTIGTLGLVGVLGIGTITAKATTLIGTASILSGTSLSFFTNKADQQHDSYSKQESEPDLVILPSADLY